jgi:hypothetical protein
MEDACLQKRCLAFGLQIDRSNFYTIGSPEILQLFDGVSRLVSRRDPQRMKTDNGQDGLRTIHKLVFSVDKESLNPADNVYIVESDRTFVVNVSSFMTMVRFETDSYHEYDLREPVSKVVFPDRETTSRTNIPKEEWSNIPYHPSDDERNPEQQQQNQQQLQLQQLQQLALQQQFLRQQALARVNIFSPEYARLAGVKPRATTSANIGLGGIRR